MIDSIANDDFDGAKVALKTTVATFMANDEISKEDETETTEKDESEAKSE